MQKYLRASDVILKPVKPTGLVLSD